ncbi:MAG: hypothetical protein ACTSRZ_02745 [Promethearchaeota archaeon]
MSNIKYEDDLEIERVPFLKFLVLLLGIIPIPLLIVALRDLVIILVAENADLKRWIGGLIFELITAGFCYCSAVGIYNLKRWAPYFVSFGFIIAIIGLIFYIVADPEIFTFREFGIGLQVAILAILLLGILSIFKNKEIFVN